MSRMGLMRTTVEISDEHRAELLKIAGERGEKGFSGVIREALEFFLEHMSHRDERVKSALGLRGVLTAKEGEQLEMNVKRIRKNWR